MIKTLPLFIISTLALTAIIEAEATLEERLAQLEKRVELLESLRHSPNNRDAKEVMSSTSAPIYADSFESGVGGWDISIRRYAAPFMAILRNDQKAHWNNLSQIQQCSPWRTTKSLTVGDSKLLAPDGKRFLTAFSSESECVVSVSGIDLRSGYSKSWRSLRYIVQKEAVSLANVKMPVASFQLAFHAPPIQRSEKLPRGSFQAGYIVEGENVSDFKPLMTLQESVDGWQNYEIDLSAAPKDKAIQLVFLSLTADSRIAQSSGVQLDCIKIVDDGV